MQARTKAIACLCLVAAIGVWVWSSTATDEPPRPSTPSSDRVEGAESGTNSSNTVLAPSLLGERIPLTTNVPVEAPAVSPPEAPTVCEVRVEEESGRAVAGATVWFVKPGFDYASLEPARADLYSRSTESFLRSDGCAQVTDEHGSTRIPVEAARQVVVARWDNLYGTNWPRGNDAFQRIVVTAHHTLVVETVDADGWPVSHVKVVAQPVLRNGFADPMAQWTLGSTDEMGRLTQVLAVPSEANPVAEIRLHAELLDGPHAEEKVDPAEPLNYVRLVLPVLGRVRVRLRHSDGSAPDALTLDSLSAELAVVGIRPRSAPGALLHAGSSPREYASLDVDGSASFENVALDHRMQLRFPGLVVEPETFAGPTRAERLVTVVHTIHPDHPRVSGTLIGTDGRLLGEAAFTLLAPDNPDLPLAVRGKTDARGQFVTWLADGCTGHGDVVLQFGMDWEEKGPARQAVVRVDGPLLGEIGLGRVVMSERK